MFTGTSGSLTHSAPFGLSVTIALSSAPPSRTRYIRTDSVSFNTDHGVVYNPNTAQFFVSDPGGSKVFPLTRRQRRKSLA